MAQSEARPIGDQEVAGSISSRSDNILSFRLIIKYEMPHHKTDDYNDSRGEILTLTTLWTVSADGKSMIFFLIFLENRIWHFMQIVSSGDNLHDMSNPIFGISKKNSSKCRLLKSLSSRQSVRTIAGRYTYSVGTIICVQHEKTTLTPCMGNEGPG